MKERSTLRRMKEGYDAIPLPPELEERVRAAIAEGKRRSAWRERARRGVTRLCGTVAAAAASLVILVNVSPTAAEAMGSIPVLGPITQVLTFRTYVQSEGNATAHIQVPQVPEGGQTINKAIQEYTDTIIAEYQRDAAELMAYDGPEAESAHYDLDLSYTVVTDNDVLFALRFDKTLIMASGAQWVKIYNVDKNTGEILSLGDLFRPESSYLDVLTQSIRRQMQQQMEEDGSDVCYWMDSEYPQLDFTRLREEANFYINGGGELVIVFDEGEVAPMSMGVVEFVIPTQDIQDIVREEYFSQA